MDTDVSLPGVDDLFDVAHAAAVSLPIIEEEERQIRDGSPGMVEDLVVPMWVEGMRLLLMGEYALIDLEREVTRAQSCAMACFGMGVEWAMGTLPKRQAGECLLGVCTVYACHLVDHLQKLLDHDAISELEWQAHGHHVAEKVYERGWEMTQYGQAGAPEMERVSDEFRRKLAVFALDEEGDDDAGILVPSDA